MFVWSFGVWVLKKGLSNAVDGSCVVHISIKGAYISCDNEGFFRYIFISDFVNKVICVFQV